MNFVKNYDDWKNIIHETSRIITGESRNAVTKKLKKNFKKKSEKITAAVGIFNDISKKFKKKLKKKSTYLHTGMRVMKIIKIIKIMKTVKT